ncbi:nuclear pore complex protein GP210 [Selaginella moellendorffii]|uniref:nuclear pore complex protein GP210 n=1 Tax=Selaginella moellendorffii TaxID=88036 RepID=UPI000D1CB7DE|nr:nuclear pore complex protein GP210 [Selaginella moellendorffii]|eukprot:XP_024536204.1 nuclear pore complex protein GP210 [Selaginella moellendorffii]
MANAEIRNTLLLASAILFLFLGLLPARGGRPHISNLNVLLPPRTTTPVRYRLQGTDGCFVWTWDHHDIISLVPEYNGTSSDCSTSALITPLSPFEERQATAVHATDTVTGEILRCEVFIDKISRIQIFHHSVKLDLDGWATLRIRAFDAEENVFSSLVGLKFAWQLSSFDPAGETLPQKLLHVPLKDSPLSDCGCMCGDLGTQIELEDQGFGSDLYVVRGVSTGQERVKARLVEPRMEELDDTLVLTVAEAISLEPHSPLYIIPGTSFRFKLKAMRKNVLSEIPLPSVYHKWSVTNEAVASVDQNSALIAAKVVGVTNVIVEDVRVKGHQQMATVHVVIPTRLELHLLPLYKKEAHSRKLDVEGRVSGETWYIVSGREYVVNVRAFALDSARALYLTQSNDLRLLFTYLPYWEAVEVPEDVSSEHGWQNATLLKANAEGAGTIVAKLVYNVDSDVKVLKLEQAVVVCPPVLIALERATSVRAVFLPWSPGSSQEYQLKAEGGCGDISSDYVWSSTNPSVATVNALGKILSKGPGKTVIRSSSAKDLLNVDEIHVEVSVPSSISVVHGLPVEVEINTILPVAVSLTTPAGHAYSRCDVYNSFVQWDLFGVDGNFNFVDSSGPFTLSDISSYLRPEESSSQVVCAWNAILPLRPGRATVTGSLKVSTVEAAAALETSWAIASYAPLALQQVSDGNSCGGYSCSDTSGQSTCHNLKELLLVVGSGIKVMLVGGPERWRQESQFLEFHEIVSSEAGGKASEEVLVTRSTDGGGRVFFVGCSDFGNYTLIFRRGYQDLEGPVNVVASSSLLVVCDVPSSIVLIIDEPDNSQHIIKSVVQLERDQERKRLLPVTVLNSRSIRVAALGLHSSGRPFANTSSMALSWHLDECDALAYWDDLDVPPDRWERILGLQNTVGLCAVRATLTHLKQSKLPVLTVVAAASLLKQAKPFLHDTAQLQLVAALRLEPKETLLFGHPDAKATLQVLGGTNDIESHVNDSRIAVVIHPPTGPRVSHLVVAARAMGTAVVSILDVGLASPASANALVHVVDISWIKVVPDVVTMELGTMLEVHLQVGDSTGRTFDPSQFVLFNIHVHLQDEIISLTSTRVPGNSFYIQGADIGFSSFHVTAQKASGREIHSTVVKAEVYAPLKVIPSPLVMAPGAQFMLVVHGGPRTGKVVEFSSSESLIAVVDRNSGLVTAKSAGNEVILARAFDNDGNLLGEAFTEITVAIPVSMYLEVRGGQLGTGREMSIYPFSNEGNLFSFFEMCTNYEWLVADEEVLQLESVKPASSGHTQKFPDGGSESTWLVDAGFSARVFGKSAGMTTVSVSFICQFHTLGGHSVPKNYSASGSISVIPDPPLALGMLATWVLPPGHRSSKLLPQRVVDGLTTRAITYTLMHDGVAGSEIFTIDDGRINTADRMDVACIHAKDRDAGRSEIAVCVRVAEVAQMTVGDRVHVSELSVGTQHSFIVNLRDNIGTPFFEVDLESLPLSLETNRADVVSLKATKLEASGGSTTVAIVVQALRQGKALIRISQKQKVDIADYILVFVGAYVYPRNPVMHIGDRVNFSIAGKGFLSSGVSSLDRGQWSSGNEHIVLVNSRTGEAEALSEGSTVVSFNGSRLTAYTSLSVVGISTVTVEAPSFPFVTNAPFPDQGYKFTVKFKDTHGDDVSVIGESRPISYDCKVDPSFIGRAAPWHDPDSGTFYCLFFPYAPEKLSYNLHGELKSKRATSDRGDAKGRIGMSVTAVLSRTPSVAGSADCTFAGGFSIIDTPSQLQLSVTSNKSRIAVVGTVGAIAVSWQRKDAVEVKRLTRTEEPGVCGHAVYEVLLLEEDKSFTDKLVFLLTTTGQREEISMAYDAGQFNVAALFQQIFTVAVITLVAIVLPVFLCTKLLDLPRSLRSSPATPSPTRRRPLVAQVVQDDGASGVLVNGAVDDTIQTPVQYRTYSRTPPQPYTEYVSRTIEQTPYYSRQGMRRTDPSKTY